MKRWANTFGFLHNVNPKQMFLTSSGGPLKYGLPPNRCQIRQTGMTEATKATRFTETVPETWPVPPHIPAEPRIHTAAPFYRIHEFQCSPCDTRGTTRHTDASFTLSEARARAHARTHTHCHLSHKEEAITVTSVEIYICDFENCPAAVDNHILTAH